MEIDGNLSVVTARSTGTVDVPNITIDVAVGSHSSLATTKPSSEMARILAMELDIRPFYSMAKGDHFLSQATQKFYGLHPPQTTSVFEALIIAIVGQQISSVVGWQHTQSNCESVGNPNNARE